MKKVTSINKTRRDTAFLVMAVLLLVQFGTVRLYAGGSPDTNSPSSPAVNSADIRDYVCIVNRYVHPNMERYLNATIRDYMQDESKDELAEMLEYEKRGGFGSGFVYVDANGNNYIITNYHVIIGAYRLSVTFENERGGEPVVYRNLSVFSVDEREDLAILAFPNGQKPFRRGIPVSSAQLRSGNRVAAAGYPGGISATPTWNLTDGSVSNTRVTPSGEEYSFIQHSAAINPGNSGGPLLIDDTRSPVGYSVAGINTMIIRDITGANFAIPSERVNAFLQRSFQQINDEAALRNRITAFMELLERSTTSEWVFADLSSFLSSTMINADPSKAASTVPDSSTVYAMQLLIDEVKNRPVTGIAWAVAYSQIENPIYIKSRNALSQREKPEVISIEGNNMGGYTARLLINGYPYRTEWISEYRTWKLDDFMEDAGEYNDYYYLATPHPIGKKVIYSLSTGLDVDWYTLDIPRPGRLTVRTEGNIDPDIVLLYDPSVTANRNRPIASNDDYPGRGLNALASEDVRAGTVYIAVGLAAGSPGEYILLAGLDGEIDNVPYTTAAATNTTVQTSSGPQVAIVNNTGSSVWYVYISETDSDSWGPDRLASDQILRNAESVSLQLPRPINQVNRYDIRLIDSNSNEYIKWNVQVSANARITFTSADRQ